MKFLFYPRLYSGKLAMSGRRAVRMLREGKTSPALYLLVRSADGGSVELVWSVYFRQPWYRDSEILCVGIAGSWRDGVRLLSSIMQESVSRTGQTDLVRYLFPEEDGHGSGA